ncbi:GntR family transcriptional regulator [Mesorhizobium shangrilense]|uniref:GntR family transcriptional regulator n=1 Tax=Mesorhizobium shangrilense TaxID=460060 RepID=A0ABV2DLV3_9HYPH
MTVRSGLHERAFQHLRAQLFEGKLTPGQTILASDMAASMSMSLTPVREAIQRLIGHGSLEAMPNGNARVRLFSEAQIDEWWLIRTLLESLATARAAERAGQAPLADLLAINTAAKEQLDAGNVLEFARLNRNFHFSLYALAGSNVLSEIIENLWEKAGPYIVMAIPAYVQAYASGKPKHLLDPHDEVYDALLCGDGTAAAVALRRDIGMTVKWGNVPAAIKIQAVVREVRAIRPDFRLVGLTSSELENAASRPDEFQRSHAVTRSASRVERRQSEQSKARKAIREALICGQYMPGEHLTVRQLSEGLNLGVVPVREALREIGSIGPLEKLENGRLRVRLFSGADGRDILEIQALLEAIAAASAATLLKQSMLDRLKQLNEKTEKAMSAGEVSKTRLLVHAFVETICKTANLEILFEVLEHVWVMAGPIMVHYWRQVDLDAVLKWQRAMVVALADGDALGAARVIASRDKASGTFYA